MVFCLTQKTLIEFKRETHDFCATPCKLARLSMPMTSVPLSGTGAGNISLVTFPIKRFVRTLNLVFKNFVDRNGFNEL